MKRISDYAGQEMKWEQPNMWKENYELHVGDDQIATLRFRSIFGSLASGESQDGCWSFKRVGFFNTRVTIRTCDSDEDIAVYKPNTWTQGGSLEFPDGRKYKASTNFWMTKYEIKTEDEIPLLRFHNHGLVRPSAIVEVLPEAVRLAELPWLVMLGWYLVILMYEDSSAAMTATTAVS